MKKVWDWFNEKKTIFAAFYWGCSGTIILIWFPNGLPPVPNKVYLTAGVLLTFLGLGHKVMKKIYPDRMPDDSK